MDIIHFHSVFLVFRISSIHSHGFNYLDEGLELGGKLLLEVDSAVDTIINIIKIQ